MHDIHTNIGTFTIDDGSEDDSRICVEPQVVDALGPNSTYAWPTDQMEALQAAAEEAGAQANLLVPGGWRITPGSAMPQVEANLKRLANAMQPTDRQTVV